MNKDKTEKHQVRSHESGISLCYSINDQKDGKDIMKIRVAIIGN